MQEASTAEAWSLRGFVRLARLKFLLYNIVLVGLGVAVTVRLGHDLDLAWYLFAQAFAWIVHIMTHYCNEYFDLEADRANVYYTPWTGGSRALVDGLVHPVVSLGTAFVLWTVALLLIAAMPTGQARLLAALSVALAWFYTAPPLQLNYRGLGEVTVAVVLNGLWPMLAATLQMGRVPWMLVAILVPTMILQTVRMMVMNLGDRVSDELAGKRTLPVLIGHARAVAAITAGQFVAYTGMTVFAAIGWLPWTVWVAMMMTLPLSVSLVAKLRRGDMRDVNAVRMTPVVFLASNHISLVVAAAMCGVVVDTHFQDAPGVGTGLLAVVLAVFALLFAYRLSLARRATGLSA